MDLNPNIQPADPQARRRAVIVVLTTAVLGALLIYLFNRALPQLSHWLAANLEAILARPAMVIAVALLFMTPIFAASGYLFVLANRIINSERLPPPGQAVVRDTPVLEGAPAVRRGRALQIIAGMLSVGALVMAMWCWQLLKLMADVRVSS